MKTVDAKAVAEELLRFFPRVGIPKEILTDEGTNFTSQLLAELYRLLHVDALRTRPYHLQTDGLVERVNGTPKEMLRKSTQVDGRDWYKLLPYALFAYREALQESIYFSPFELLYVRDVRGSLDVVKEEWETHPKSDLNVVSHIMMMREHLEMSGLVQENLEGAQRKQKTWYDQTARKRTLSPGEQVLVLLPTSTSKLLAQCHAPYEVIGQVGSVNYLIAMPEWQKKKGVFHINMLKKWKEEASVAYFVMEGGDEEDELEAHTWDGGGKGEPAFGEGLTEGQRDTLKKILSRHQGTLTAIPECTNLAQYRITTGDASLIRLPRYHLPHAYRDMVR